MLPLIVVLNAPSGAESARGSPAGTTVEPVLSLEAGDGHRDQLRIEVGPSPNRPAAPHSPASTASASAETARTRCSEGPLKGSRTRRTPEEPRRGSRPPRESGGARQADSPDVGGKPERSRERGRGGEQEERLDRVAVARRIPPRVKDGRHCRQKRHQDQREIQQPPTRREKKECAEGGEPAERLVSRMSGAGLLVPVSGAAVRRVGALRHGDGPHRRCRSSRPTRQRRRPARTPARAHRDTAA